MTDLSCPFTEGTIGKELSSCLVRHCALSCMAKDNFFFKICFQKSEGTLVLVYILSEAACL